jgi:type IV pilus assembly protein PilM
MAKRLSGALGIDIGSRKIKVAEIKSQGKGDPIVSALAMIDTPEGAVDHTGVYNAEAVGIALKQALSQAGASVSHAVVSIAGQASVLVRTLEVPRMSPSELTEHMQWEINRNIPFAESNVLSDFKQLEDEDPDSANMEVVMAISPQSAIDTVVACVKKAGRQVAAIDVQALSIARSLKVSYDDIYMNETVCIVDVGHLTTSINIYKNGRLLLPRQVPVGGEMFTKAIADAMSVGVEEAELLKQQKCHIHPELLQQAVGDPFAFGGGVTDLGGGGLTQEFQPYNPFAEDPATAPIAAPEPMSEPAIGAGPEGAPTAPADLPLNPYEDQGHNPYASADEPMPYGSTEEAVPAEEPVPHDEGTVSYDPYAASPAPVAAMSSPVASDPETQKINNAVAPVLEEFVAEVRRSLDYFRSKGGDVHRVALSGGASKLTGLSDTLGVALNIPCDMYDPLRNVTISGKRIEPDFVEEHRPDFLVAVGNGLHIFFD